VWRAKQLPLGLAFVVLGGVAWWIQQRQPQPPVAEVPRVRLPDYVVSDFEAVETDDSGRPTRLLRAPRMRQYVAENLAELDLPRLTLYSSEGPPWEAESQSGLVLSGGKEVKLRQDVHVSRVAGPRNRSVLLVTESLNVWPDQQYAQSDSPVRIDSERDWLTASGVKLWYQSPMRAQFPGRVHILTHPDEKTEPEGAGARS
jgi:lipopolysaccharide export system protein LptC